MKKYIVFILFALTTLHMLAADLNGIKWISVNQSLAEPNQRIRFRKDITIGEKYTNADFFIAVDSKYW